MVTRKALAEIRDAKDRVRAEAAITRFAALFGAKYPKAVAKIADDREQLLVFYDFPAEHWVHLKTSKPIESTFATVRLRTKVTKGPGSRAAGLTMVFKLLEAAQEHWRYSTPPTWSLSSEPEPTSTRESWSSGPSKPLKRSPRDRSGNAVHNY